VDSHESLKLRSKRGSRRDRCRLDDAPHHSHVGKNKRRKCGTITSSMASDDVTREVAYIIRRAQHNEARVVILGQLIYFSAQSGDAWMLDPVDHLALWLA